MSESCLGRALLSVALMACALPAQAAEEWYRVQSRDGRASVLFPFIPEDVTELRTRTPGGSVVTRVAEHQGDGILLSISASQLPRLAVRFAGPEFILDNSKGGVLSSAIGRELSSEPLELEGARAALVMRYEAAHFEDERHPGFAGLALFAFVDSYVYVINSMISKSTPDNEAMQEKLLRSFRIE